MWKLTQWGSCVCNLNHCSRCWVFIWSSLGHSDLWDSWLNSAINMWAARTAVDITYSYYSATLFGHSKLSVGTDSMNTRHFPDHCSEWIILSPGHSHELWVAPLEASSPYAYCLARNRRLSRFLESCSQYPANVLAADTTRSFWKKNWEKVLILSRQ